MSETDVGSVRAKRILGQIVRALDVSDDTSDMTPIGGQGTPIHAPGPGDAGRDLRADYERLRCLEGPTYLNWLADQADDGWQAAIRRAHAAEAELERARSLHHEIHGSHRKLVEELTQAVAAQDAQILELQEQSRNDRARLYRVGAEMLRLADHVEAMEKR